MTFEEALPLVRALSAADKLRLIDELSKELLGERRAASAPASGQAAAPVAQEPPDVADEARWSAWLDSALDTAAARIDAAQREMRARGILDDAGGLLAGRA